MRVMTRIALAITSAIALLALVAGTALAGGWAEVTVAPVSGDPPVAGEERELRLIVLQHGITPVNWGDVNLTGRNAATGETVTVAATNMGDGEWIASVTFPTDGSWEIVVAHSDLETSALPALSVEQPSAAWLPAAIALAVLAAMGALGIATATVARSKRRSAPSVVHGLATRVEG